MKENSIKPILQLIFIAACVVLLIWLGGAGQVQSAPTQSAPLQPIIVQGITTTLSLPSMTNSGITPLAVIVDEDFEGTWPGAWTLVDQSADDGGTYRWGKRNCHPHTGGFAGWSVGGGDQGGNLSCSDDYPNNIDTWAVYGPFNLSNATAASLTYHFWGETEGGGACPFDYLAVMSSINGSSFSGQGHCGNATNGPAGNGYYQDTLDLSNRLGQNQVWVAFRFVSDISITYNGMTIDDITLNVTTDNDKPDPPTALIATPVSQTQLSLTWQDNSNNETGFKIERSLTGTGGWSQIAVVGINIESYANTGLTCETTYYYRVRAYNSNGNSAYSNTANATTFACPPQAPTSLTATAISATQINLSWQDNSNNETGFKIERSPNGTTGWLQIAQVGVNTTTYTNSGLACNTTYSYRVRAYNAGGNSAYSNIANATTFACPPLPPTTLAATVVSTSQINLSWQDNSNNETDFRVEQSLNEVNWTEIATMGANTTSYTNTNLTCDTTYYYRVRAHNAAGYSSYSNTADAPINCTNTGSSRTYLPLILHGYTPPQPGAPPVDGAWTGSTSRSQPMSFKVVSNGANWNTFKLKTDFQVGPCSGTTEITVFGPGTINNKQFSSNSGSFSFSGQFTSSKNATGNYAYTNYSIVGCGILNQSGTWSASIP